MNLSAAIVKQLLEKVKTKLEAQVKSRLIKILIDDAFSMVENELIEEVLAELKADGIILP